MSDELQFDTAKSVAKAEPREAQSYPAGPEQQGDIMGMLLEAVQKGADPGALKALMEMRKELKDEWAKEEYFKALAAFQSELPPIKKTRPVKNKAGTIIYYFAPLDSIVSQVKDLIKKHGFSYLNKPVQQDAKAVTATVVIHHVGGWSEESSFTVSVDEEAYMSGPQKTGSTGTFAKRYAFCNGFGILTTDEDTDGVVPIDPEVLDLEILDMIKKVGKNGQPILPANWISVISKELSAEVPNYERRKEFWKKASEKIREANK